MSKNNESTTTKYCKICDKTKSVSDFGKNRRRKDGLMSHCKPCENERKRKQYKRNSEKIKARSQKYREENPEDPVTKSERGKEYYRENRDRILEEQRLYRDRNKEKIKKRNAEWYRENREEVLSYQKEYREGNVERIKEYHKKYREDNLDRIREYEKRWYEENPEKWLLKAQRRRARKASLPNSLTIEQMREIMTFFNDSCALTGCNEDVHWDHVIPIATGHGGTIIENMIPLRADINKSKNDSNIFEWFSENKERFDLSQDNFDRLIEYLAEINEMTVEEYRDYVYDCHGNVIEVC